MSVVLQVIAIIYHMGILLPSPMKVLETHTIVNHPWKIANLSYLTMGLG